MTWRTFTSTTWTRASTREAFVASDEALKHLARIHKTSTRFTDRVTRQVGTIWEKALLVIWVLAVIFFVGRVATEERFFFAVSPFLWPIGLLAVSALVFSGWKLYELFVRKPPDVRRVRAGLSVLLFLDAAILGVSASGLLYSLRWYAYHSFDGAPETVFRMFATWTLATSSMMILGLLTATLTAFLWFMLANLVARFERREAKALLAA
ncbi:MAG: hypothetical protein ACE5GX_08135 [Thermoanaerobaculia bacterium]